MPLSRAIRSRAGSRDSNSSGAETETSPNDRGSKRVNVIEHPLAMSALTSLRDKRTPPDRFRTMSNLLLMLLTIDALRDLPTRDRVISPTAGPNSGKVEGKPVLFISVNRSGIGLVHNVVDHVPNLRAGSISFESHMEAGYMEPQLHLPSTPALDRARVILFQPVIATGHSANIALDLLTKAGSDDAVIVTYMISFEGLNRIHTRFPNVSIWAGMIDSDWNSARGPMPGFGKLSERLFG
jgi:uracil phosphoribosyltransferase